MERNQNQQTTTGMQIYSRSNRKPKRFSVARQDKSVCKACARGLDNYTGALQFVSESSSGGVIPLTDDQMAQLKEKQPNPQQGKLGSLLSGPINDAIPEILNRHVALHNIRVQCPTIATNAINTYRLSVRLFITRGQEILPAEGTTQGDPLAMGLYALSIQPLITSLKVVCKIKQCWFAADASGNGLVAEIKRWWHPISAIDPDFSYLISRWQEMLDYHQARERGHSERSVQGNSYQYNSSRSETFGCGDRFTTVC